MIRRALAFALLGSAAFAAEPATDDALAARIARVENGLLPPARVVGVKSEPWTLTRRMMVYHVPGVSIAVIDHGAIEWARGYGIASLAEARAVTADTLFQAASISKPVSATAALALVDAGQLALDDDVNAKLKSWHLPAAPVAAGEPVTLRRLLSHTAGVSVHGFAGYAPDAPRPTLAQLLDGVAPANSEPIRITLQPGTKWRYSGGGYSVVQQLLLDVSGADFPTLLRDRVLHPAGMDASTYEQPLPAALAPRAAAGYRADGSAVEGGAHIYPELAAAGLWTTPSDLARFALALQHSLAGQSGPLSRASAEAMITPVLAGSDYGLGLGVKGDGDQLQLSHNGANEGFRCMLVSYPRTGRGAVIMTNSDNGGLLANEILRALAREYRWPDYQVIEKTALNLPQTALADFVGRYGREDQLIAFYRDQGHFYMKPAGQPRSELFAQSEHEFFLLNHPEVYSFERDASGEVTHVIRRGSPMQIFQRVR